MQCIYLGAKIDEENLKKTECFATELEFVLRSGRWRSLYMCVCVCDDVIHNLLIEINKK